MIGKVVITGAGVVSPIGNNLQEVMKGIETGMRGIGKIGGFNTDFFPSDLGAEVKDNGIAQQWNSDVDRKEVFLKKALSELYNMCNWIQKYSPSSRIMNLGAGLDYFDLPGFVNSLKNGYKDWREYSNNTYKIVESLANEYQIDGGFSVNVTACVASTQAIGLSYRMLRNTSESIIMISGGFDSMLNPLHYMGFYKLGALSNWEGDPGDSCRPFDKKRCGLVLGEGAVVFLLQNGIEADPATILAEITGYSSTMDAYMVTDPDPNGRSLAKAALNAIEEAALSPDDIDCVHLHGTGTIKNELAEYEAMKLIFKDRYKEIPVFSMKGQIGHLIAACGAMEMLGVIYSLQTQSVPVTVNYEEDDPDVHLFVVKDKPLKMDINRVLKLNSAFGGQNTALVISRYFQ